MISVITDLSLNLSEEFRVAVIVPAADVVGQQRFRPIEVKEKKRQTINEYRLARDCDKFEVRLRQAE